MHRVIIAIRKSIPAWAAGIIATLGVLIAIELLRRAGILRIPNPAALALIAVVYAGYKSGLWPGMASAALVVLYGLYLFSSPQAFLRVDGDNAGRVMVLALVGPFIAWLTGALKARAERALQQTVDAQRVHVVELQRAELRIKRREMQLRALLDALPAYVAYVDRDMVVRFHNRPYEEWTGLPASFIDGRRIAEVIGEELFESGTKFHAMEALAGRSSIFERTQADSSGRRRVVEAHFIPDVADDGEVAGFFGMLFDVSHHKESQARIARLTERLRRTLAGSRLALWELDLTTGMVELGREWAAIVGGEDVMSRVKSTELRQRVHPDDRARVDGAVQALIERRAEQYDVEHRVQALDGEWKWIQSTGKAVEFDSSGRPIRLSGTNRDITSRKRAELALQENELRLRLVTDAVPAMIVYVDTQQRYQFCNRQYSETMGRNEAEILGWTVHEVVGQAQYDVARPWLEKALAGQKCEHERRHMYPDGTSADLSVTYVPHVADDGEVRGLYCLLVDLTERKRAERIKERFISMVSHELRTPLTSIIWTLEALAEHRSDAMTGEDAAMIGIAHQNAERMLHLADEILDIEKIDQSELQMSPRRVGVAEIVDRAMALNQGMASKHRVTLHASKTQAAEVIADPDRLLQVLSNQ